MNTLDVIKQLQATTKRTEKEQIISDAWDSGNRDFFEAVQLAYDPLIVFHVKKVPEIKGADEDEGGEEYGWQEFKQLADQLRNRQLTGNAARDALYSAAEIANVGEWNHIFRRVLLKDLRCGISETTVNKILKKKGAEGKKYLVTKFGCQLADTVKGTGESLTGKYYCDQKFDGVRLITILDKDKGTVTQFSRNGKQITNFEDIRAGLEAVLKDMPGSLVLDGEIISNSFQDLMKQVHRKENVQTDDAKYALFDILPLKEFLQGKSTASQQARQTALEAMQPHLQQHLGDRAFVVPKKVIDFDSEDGLERFQSFLQETLAAGYEGVMVKDMDARYECKRSKGWMKWKPTLTVDLTVTDVEEGTGRNEGRLGALVCEGEHEGKSIRVNVGSGYSDEQRDTFWADKDAVIGQVVEVMADTVSKDQSDDDTHSLRFPRFVRFRGFEPGEKM
jgi:DNA ligase-1